MISAPPFDPFPPFYDLLDKVDFLSRKVAMNYPFSFLRSSVVVMSF